MPKYQLTYFDGRGRGEVIRLIFALAGQSYEDKRVTYEEWLKLKPATPFGHLPLLEVDGTQLGESFAVLRYLASVFGLDGKTPAEKARVDMLATALNDILAGIMSYGQEMDKALREEKKKKVLSESVPAFLPQLEGQLRQHGGGNGFYVGDTMTYADVVSYRVLSELELQGSHELDTHPLLKAHTERVGEEAGIKAWVQTRPKTPM